MVTMTSSGLAEVALPTDTQIRITRQFSLPKDVVYEAWTSPKHIKRWLGESRGKIEIADLREGGTWRYVMVTEDGAEVAAHGEYTEVVPNERIVSTEIFEDTPEAVQTVTFTEKDGRTTLTILVDHASKEHRDRHIKSVEKGMHKALKNVDQVARSLR
jgi:uncharacterized protein YndB with AHSA1/START domain